MNPIFDMIHSCIGVEIFGKLNRNIIHSSWNLKQNLVSQKKGLQSKSGFSILNFAIDNKFTKKGGWMRLAAHQPGYMPAIQFFQKMARADIFLLADDLQYSTRDQVNRTRIKTINGEGWLSVPVLSKGRLQQPIRNVEIDNHSDWVQKHLRTLEVNYQNAAYFGLYFDWLADLLKQPRRQLLNLNLDLIHFAKKHLFLKNTTLHRFSEVAAPGNTQRRLIQAMQQLKCDIYLVEADFRPYVDVALFESAGFQVEFLKLKQPQYWQQFDQFVPNLSIMDLLLNEGELSYRLVKP